MSKKNSVRMGPISLFTLIAVIVLAVMAVLAFVTGNAASAVSNRQAHAVTCAYQNESCAQSLYASVDGELAASRADGATNEEALERLSQNLPALVTAAETASDGKVSVSAQLQGSQVVATFLASERRLDVALTITEDSTVQVASWKLTSVQDSTNTETLWQGISN